MPLALPILSLPDPPESEEGSIDPLSLQATYEHLAETVYPFMAVRMSRPRFLTAIAVGARVCEGLEDELATDGVTPAWLVCEWVAVEAFVRAWGNAGRDARWGVPGTQKVRRALDAGRPLSAAAYLKTPRVFGYTGVYKKLAVGLQIVTEELELDDGGYELLRTWEREQDLSGFLDAKDGAGARLRDALRSAVIAGLGRGHTERPAGWPWWEPIVRHLDPGGAGRTERRWLHQRLLSPDLRQNPRDPDATRMRSELLARVETKGNAILVDASGTAPKETHFFREILSDAESASSALLERVEVIDAYEQLSRVAEDGLALVQHLSTEKRGAVGADDFAGHPLGRDLAARARPAAERLASLASRSTREAEVRQLADRYHAVEDVRSLFETVLAHHEEAQRAKPPEGKRPWLERMSEHDVIVRAQYRREQAPAGETLYVRNYRSSTASSFLRDLGRLTG